MPKKVDKEQKRKKILEAAISVFAKKGTANSKMADVADAAQVGKGTIYEYFQSKEEIFTAAFHYVMKKTEETIANRLSSTSDPLEKLCSYFDAWKEIFLSEFKDYIKIMIDFWAEGIRNKDEVVAFNLKKIYDEHREILKTILDECVLQGKIRPVNTHIAASIIIGALDGEIVQWITDRDLFKIEESFHTMVNIILNGLIKKERF